MIKSATSLSRNNMDKQLDAIVHDLNGALLKEEDHLKEAI